MHVINWSNSLLHFSKFNLFVWMIDKSTSYLRKFEAEVAKKFEMEDAVFMPSGTMAQNIALLIHSNKENLSKEELNRSNPLRFACHHSSHLLLWEEESYSKLAGMEAVEISTIHKNYFNNGKKDFRVPPMRLSDVEDCFESQVEALSVSGSLSDDGLSSLIIELPHRELGGKLTPWNEVLSIGELCRKEGVFFHCDGARIFEASAGYK